jgi:IS4 transposase
MSPTPASEPAASREALLADELDATLRDLLSDTLPAPSREPRGPGQPPTVPAALLWTGFLLCVLRGFTAQRNVWRLLSFHGFWGHARIDITEQAIYQRLARASDQVFQDLFARISGLLQARFAQVNDVPYAAFATAILAFDHSTLDPIIRKLKLWRKTPAGSPDLLVGRLATLFDVRRQMFQRVEFEEDPHRNVKFDLERWLEHFQPGNLVLIDLGYFAFAWFDQLTQRGVYYVSRLRNKTTWVECQVLYAGGSSACYVREVWVYLGKYRADRAAHPVRLVEVTCHGRTWRYVTNVLDPKLLPAHHIVALYRRRWDIETAFNLLKTHLGLFLLASGRRNVVRMQVYATLIIAQVVLALRTELALRVRAELREVSLPLMLESLVQLAKDGKDPLHELALHGRRMKIIRPLRGKEYTVHVADPADYQYPPAPPPPRQARSAQKDNGPRASTRRPTAARPRQRTTGWGARGGRRGGR